MRQKRKKKSSFLLRRLRKSTSKYPLHDYIRKPAFKAIMFTALVERHISEINVVDDDGYSPLMLLIMYNRPDGLYVLFSRAIAHDMCIQVNSQLPEQSGCVAHLVLKCSDVMTISTFFQQSNALLCKRLDEYEKSLFESLLFDVAQEDSVILVIVYWLLKSKFQVPTVFENGTTLIENVLERLTDVKSYLDKEEREESVKLTIKIVRMLSLLDIEYLKCSKNSTIVHHCIYNNHPLVLDFVLKLLKAKDDSILKQMTCSVDDTGYSPLFLCALPQFHAETAEFGVNYSRTECAQTLIKHGADVNETFSDSTVLDLCCQNVPLLKPQVELAALLIENGAIVYKKAESSTNNSLFKILASCNEDLIGKVIDRNALVRDVTFTFQKLNCLSVVFKSAFELEPMEIERLVTSVNSLLAIGLKVQVHVLRELLQKHWEKRLCRQMFKLVLTADCEFDEEFCSLGQMLSFALVLDTMLYSKLIISTVPTAPQAFSLATGLSRDKQSVRLVHCEGAKSCYGCGKIKENCKYYEGSVDVKAICEMCQYTKRSVSVSNSFTFLEKMLNQVEVDNKSLCDVDFLREAKIDNRALWDQIECLNLVLKYKPK